MTGLVALLSSSLTDNHISHPALSVMHSGLRLPQPLLLRALNNVLSCWPRSIMLFVNTSVGGGVPFQAPVILRMI